MKGHTYVHPTDGTPWVWQFPVRLDPSRTWLFVLSSSGLALVEGHTGRRI